MSHPTRIARILLASVAIGTITLVALASPAGAWPILKGNLRATPGSGRGGSMVLLQGSEFYAGEDVSVAFWDRNGSQIVGGATTNGMGHFELWVCVPWNATPGADMFVAESLDKRVEASTGFSIAFPQVTSRYPRVSRQRLQTATHAPRDIGGLRKKATDYPQLTSGGGGAGGPDQICV